MECSRPGRIKGWKNQPSTQEQYNRCREPLRNTPYINPMTAQFYPAGQHDGIFQCDDHLDQHMAARSRVHAFHQTRTSQARHVISPTGNIPC